MILEDKILGILRMEALSRNSAQQAMEWAARHVASQPYNPHNLLCADSGQAFVLHSGVRTEVKSLQPGLHVLSDTDVDDPHHPRVQRVRELLRERSWPTWDAARTCLEQLVRDHGAAGKPEGGLCQHSDRSGTVSSSLIALPGPGLTDARFCFSPGPPCTFPFEDLSARLQSPT